LLLSGTETESIARQALERGAQDYILKNHLDEFRLRRVVRGMIERKAAGDTAFPSAVIAEKFAQFMESGLRESVVH
jgi:hypothetical protein